MAENAVNDTGIKHIWDKGMGRIESTQSVSGNPVTITNAAPINAEDITVDIEPQQDLHGYDKPWAGGAGKNKLELNYSTTTDNGVTGTLNDDGSIELNGTATGSNATFILASGSLLTPLLNKSLILNGNPLTSGGRLQWWNYDGNNTSAVDGGSGSDAFTPTSQNGNVAIVIEENTECNHLIFKPMLRLASETDATFAPYSNICPIEGRTGAELDRVGKNWFDKTSQGITVGYALDPTNGSTYTSSSGNWDVTGFIEIEGGSDYTLSGSNGDVVFFDENKTYIVGWSSFGTRTAPQNAKYIKFDFIHANVDSVQLELGTTATAYEPYQGKTYIIPFKDAQGQTITVYGGYVGINTGVMMVDKAIVTYDGSSDEQWTVVDSARRVRCTYPFPSNIVTTSSAVAVMDCISNLYPVVSAEYTYFGRLGFSVTDGRLDVADGSGSMNLDSFKATLAATPLIICYKLATPLTIQLTPQQIQLLKGTNTVSADCGDVSLKYQPDNVIGELKGEIEAVEAELAEAEESFRIVYEDYIANTSMGIVVQNQAVGDVVYSDALDIAKTGYTPIAVTDTSVVLSTVADQGKIATHCLLDATNNRVRFYVHCMDSAASVAIPPNSLTFRVAYKKA